ncbi:winged helix-turn-helix transcriptional regulator [Clostridium sp. Marseille-QA1073]
MTIKEVVCEIEVTLDMIGGKWKPLILYFLYQEGTKRFGEIKSYLTKISHKSLTHQLRELEEDGLVKRVIFPEVPPRVEYSLTKKGKTIFPILQLICQWGEKNMNGMYKLISPLCGQI